MEVFRLTRERFAHSLSGKGAAMYGARWNSIGMEMIYTSFNRSLAMAEVAVHFTLATLPDDYMMMTLHIPDNMDIQKLRLADLPNGWNEFPHRSGTQQIGDKFLIDNSYCILQVPSVVTFGDYNLLINPKHSDFEKIKIIALDRFILDRRIFK